MSAIARHHRSPNVVALFVENSTERRKTGRIHIAPERFVKTPHVCLLLIRIGHRPAGRSALDAARGADPAMTDVHFHALEPARNRNGEDALVPFLLGARHLPVTISARDVGRLDSHRLQILLVAQKQWASEGIAFQLTDANDTFRAGLERLGLAPDHFDKDPLQ
ncbi:STAS domain-containing protein [Salipiger thiooxidans]|uniref:STAS domain-containing protein n=1 Tax=Salipiger thiooxidans TaxID=282683 RepID=UPI001F5C3251|nr:STAS domain-containing protein [Salipiger thiooxidans]